MADRIIDPNRAPVAFGWRAVPLLFRELKAPDTDSRRRALTSLCDLMHNTEYIYQAVDGGFLDEIEVLFKDEDPSVRTKTCQLLFILTGHSIGRLALLSASLLSPLAHLLDDSSSSCRRNVHHTLNRFSLWPLGASALLNLVPKLMLKLSEEEEEEVQVLLLSTISSCSKLDPLPSLASGGVSLLGHNLSHQSPSIRREAAAAMMALSVCEDGKRQVCADRVLPVLVDLLQDKDIEVQVNAAGVIMYAVTITAGKKRCLELDVIPALLHLVSKTKEEEEEKDPQRRGRRKALVMYCLRALTSLAEAPVGRCLLLDRLPLLAVRSEEAEEDHDIRRVAQTAVRVITWKP